MLVSFSEDIETATIVFPNCNENDYLQTRNEMIYVDYDISCLVSSRGIDIVEFAMEKDLIPSTPHQPKNFKFPKRSFGKKNQYSVASSPLGFLSGCFCITTKPKMLYYVILV